MIRYDSALWVTLSPEQQVNLLRSCLYKAESTCITQLETNFDLKEQIAKLCEELKATQEKLRIEDVPLKDYRIVQEQLTVALRSCAYGADAWKRLLGSDVAGRIDDAIGSNKKIFAIKDFRRVTGAGLMLSREAVEARIKWLEETE